MANHLTETLRAENKVTKVVDPTWNWDMVRSAAALYNSGGGILRIGVNDNGTISGGHNPVDYLADHSVFAKTLHDFLDGVPPFESKPIGGYIKITVRDGVTSPSILRKPLEHGKNPNVRYELGTVFIRKMNGAQPSSGPPQNRSDWQTVLHLWETNRGVTLQGQIIVQFTVLLNEWNPFNEGNTKITRWKAKCLADVATPLGRKTLAARLNEIVGYMQFASAGPKSVATMDQDGSDYKRPIAEKISQLCIDLDLSPPTV